MFCMTRKRLKTKKIKIKRMLPTSNLNQTLSSMFKMKIKVRTENSKSNEREKHTNEKLKR